MLSSTPRYTTPAIILHWVIALLMIVMLFFGEGLIRVPESTSLAGWKPTTHASLGIMILLLGLARLVWRLGHKPPPLPSTTPRWQAGVSHAVHWTFYAFFVAIPVMGLLAIVPYGVERQDLDAVTFFGVFPVAFLPDLGEWVGHAHVILAKLAQILVIVHVLAALKHQFWDKDRLIQRMNPL